VTKPVNIFCKMNYTLKILHAINIKVYLTSISIVCTEKKIWKSVYIIIISAPIIAVHTIFNADFKKLFHRVAYQDIVELSSELIGSLLNFQQQVLNVGVDDTNKLDKSFVSRLFQKLIFYKQFKSLKNQ